MPDDKSTAFTRLSDGTILLRRRDGSFLPVASETDLRRLAALTESEIEHMAATDPDHPALDETFWTRVDDQQEPSDVVSIRLDEDVRAYFLKQGRGYQTRINAVLRHYVVGVEREEAAKHD